MSLKAKLVKHPGQYQEIKFQLLERMRQESLANEYNSAEEFVGDVKTFLENL